MTLLLSSKPVTGLQASQPTRLSSRPNPKAPKIESRLATVEKSPPVVDGWVFNSKPFQQPVLAVVDEFKQRKIPLYTKRVLAEDYDDVFVSHGDLVAAHARLAVPGIDIQQHQVAGLAEIDFCDPNPALEELQDQLDAGNRVDAVNLSFSVSVPFQRLRTAFGLGNLSPENISEYRKIIRNGLESIRLNEVNPETRRIFEEYGLNPTEELDASLKFLERMGEKVPVFIAAGNDGPEAFNLMLLAKNTTGVGAAKPRNQKSDYSGNNQFVTRWANARNRPVPVLDEQERLTGFNLQSADDLAPFHVTKKGNPFIPKSSMKSRQAHRENFWLEKAWAPQILNGTSFAAPQVAAREALNRALKLPQIQPV